MKEYLQLIKSDSIMCKATLSFEIIYFWVELSQTRSASHNLNAVGMLGKRWIWDCLIGCIQKPIGSWLVSLCYSVAA